MATGRTGAGNSVTDAATFVEKSMITHPEVQLVLEIALRARCTELTQAPQDIGVASDVIATPISSQCPV